MFAGLAGGSGNGEGVPPSMGCVSVGLRESGAALRPSSSLGKRRGGEGGERYGGVPEPRRHAPDEEDPGQVCQAHSALHEIG